MNLRIRHFSQRPQKPETSQHTMLDRLTAEDFDALLDLNPHDLERPELLACFNQAVDALKAERAKVAELNKENHAYCMILAGCSSVAFANTPESHASVLSELHPDYEHASLHDVHQAIGREIKERARAEVAEAQLTALREGLEGLPGNLAQFIMPSDNEESQAALYDVAEVAAVWLEHKLQSLLTQTAPTVNSEDKP